MTTTINHKAFLAIYAANMRHQWGNAAARQYAAKRGILGLYRLACQLQAVEASDSFNFIV